MCCILGRFPVQLFNLHHRYSYSKTRGLFGGVSIEGSVIVERQDANGQAYHSDVTAKMLLNGAIPPPEWALPLTRTLEQCTGLPGNHKWVQEFDSRHSEDNYPFGGMESPRPDGESSSAASQRLKKKGNRGRSSSNPYSDSFDPDERPGDTYASSKSSFQNRDSLDEPWQRGELTRDRPTTEFFATKFESDFVSDEHMKKHPPIKSSPEVRQNRLVDDHDFQTNSPFMPSSYKFTTPPTSNDAVSHKRSISAYTPPTSARRGFSNPFSNSPPLKSPSPLGGRRSVDYLEDLDGRAPPDTSSFARKSFKNPFAFSPSPKPVLRSTASSNDYLEDLDGNGPPPRYDKLPKLTPTSSLMKPVRPEEGIARAIALYDFKAVQVCLLLRPVVPMIDGSCSSTQPGDLSFNKGQVIVVKQMSDTTDTWLV